MHVDDKTHAGSSEGIPSSNLHGDRGTPRCTPWAWGEQQGLFCQQDMQMASEGRETHTETLQLQADTP